MDFVAAVECLMTQPSLYPEIEAARSAFDDFVALHWNITGLHHMSVSVPLQTGSRTTP
jgi:hypothetical protein